MIKQPNQQTTTTKQLLLQKQLCNIHVNIYFSFFVYYSLFGRNVYV